MGRASRKRAAKKSERLEKEATEADEAKAVQRVADIHEAQIYAEELDVLDVDDLGDTTVTLPATPPSVRSWADALRERMLAIEIAERVPLPGEVGPSGLMFGAPPVVPTGDEASPPVDAETAAAARAKRMAGLEDSLAATTSELTIAREALKARTQQLREEEAGHAKEVAIERERAIKAELAAEELANELDDARADIGEMNEVRVEIEGIIEHLEEEKAHADIVGMEIEREVTAIAETEREKLAEELERVADDLVVQRVCTRAAEAELLLTRQARLAATEDATRLSYELVDLGAENRELRQRLADDIDQIPQMCDRIAALERQLFVMTEELVAIETENYGIETHADRAARRDVAIQEVVFDELDTMVEEAPSVATRPRTDDDGAVSSEEGVLIEDQDSEAGELEVAVEIVVQVAEPLTPDGAEQPEATIEDAVVPELDPSGSWFSWLYGGTVVADSAVVDNDAAPGGDQDETGGGEEWFEVVVHTNTTEPALDTAVNGLLGISPGWPADASDA
jgi:hypothetical protein